MSNQEVKRAVRVAERVQKELMDLLLRGAVRDPDAQDVTITDVHVTDDLRLARINIRLLEADPDRRRRDGAVAALKRARGFLRRELGRRLTMKHTPELTFFWDEGLDRAIRVQALLAEIEAEGASSEPASSASDASTPASSASASSAPASSQPVAGNGGEGRNQS